MMNLFALSLVFTSLFAAEVWSPGPAGNHPQEQQVEDVIEKEGHRVIVVETYEENGHHNTKVSISPEQPHLQQNQRQDGGVKFKSPSLVEKAKEKMEEEADYVHPNVAKGVFHGSGTEKRYPSEILCDGLGKCTQGVAKVLHMATGKVSEVAHDVMDKKKEMEHGAKDKAENLYEEAKNTASEKAHEAKELVEDVYEKAKEKTAEKAQDGKECAQESLNKVKHTVKEAKDSGKTIMSGVVHNITEKSEEVTEDVVEKTKESTKHASNRVITFLNHAKRYISDEVTALMGVVGLMGFGTAYGMCVWVTFISSYVLARVLPRQQFGVVQSKIYPVYFTAMAYSIGLALLGHLLAHNRRLLTNRAEMFQAYNLLASILMVLVNLLYLEPSATKAMFESMKIEKEEGRGREIPTAGFSEARHEQPATHATGSGTATTMPRAEETTPSPAQENREKEEMGSRMSTTSERLKTLNSYSSFLNILTLMALTWHLVYLSQRLHLPVAC